MKEALANNINTRAMLYRIIILLASALKIMEFSSFFAKSSGLVNSLVLKYTFIALAACEPLVLFGFKGTNFQRVAEKVLWSVFVPKFLEKNGLVYGPLNRIYDGIMNFIDTRCVFGRDIEIMLVELADGLHCALTCKIPCSVLERKIIVMHKGVLMIKACTYGFSEKEQVVLVCSFINVCLRDGAIAFEDLEKIRVSVDGSMFYNDMSMLECMVNWQNVMNE